MAELARANQLPTPEPACRVAVIRAFIELINLGECEHTALGVALKVFAFHQPNVSKHTASKIVQAWTRDTAS